VVVAARATDSTAGPPAPPAAQVTDLDGLAVEPVGGGAAVALIFVSSQCPISNRAVPELQRVYDEFAAQGVRLWLVYPSSRDSPEKIRAHLREYKYPMAALRDTGLRLVRRAGVRVTPEVAVFDRAGQLAYRGRVDDRFVDFGVSRPEPSRHDLAEALRSVLAGQPVELARTEAVGCSIRGASQ